MKNRNTFFIIITILLLLPPIFSLESALVWFLSIYYIFNSYKLLNREADFNKARKSTIKTLALFYGFVILLNIIVYKLNIVITSIFF